MVPRVVDRDTRRADLVGAAARCFAERGVDKTSVADIVRGAGVAQGTFYLYFDSKQDIVLAVVDEVAERLVTVLEGAVDPPGVAAAERLQRFTRAFAAASQDTSLHDLAEFLHRPENQPLHDRFAERFLPRVVPMVERMIVAGVADGSFTVTDPRAAAWFVLGGLRAIELAGTPIELMPAALETAAGLALSALGYRESHGVERRDGEARDG